MDFMLLKDGSIIPIPDEPEASKMRELLHVHGGVAQYWMNSPNIWYHLKPDTPYHLGGIKIDAQDVPEIIRLAAMLE